MIWNHATREHPCPVCGKADWCTFGDRAMLCQRVASQHAHPKGGWFHFYEDKPPVRSLFRMEKQPTKSALNCAALMTRWIDKTSEFGRQRFAESLGVSWGSVCALDAAWAWEYGAWAFPMQDGSGKAVGIRLRADDGRKWAVTGSRQGVFVPKMEPGRVAYLPEGPTDTMAAVSIGLFAVGRPSCSGGVEELREALRRLEVSKVVIVADNDSETMIADQPTCVGAVAAKRLQAALRMRSCIWQPTGGVKDLREFVRRGGTRALIESQLKDRTWIKP